MARVRGPSPSSASPVTAGISSLRTSLQQQLALLKRRRPRPVLKPFDRLFWVAVSRLWSHWKHWLIIVTLKLLCLSHVLEAALPTPGTNWEKADSNEGYYGVLIGAKRMMPLPAPPERSNTV